MSEHWSFYVISTGSKHGKGGPGVEKYFIFWDRNKKWENFLRVVDTNPV
jgi:hypothetical protein